MNFDINEPFFTYSEIKMCRICETDQINTLTCFYNPEMCNILNNLKQIIDVQTESENVLPKYICKACLINLESAIKFMKQCRGTDAKLKKSMENRKKSIVEETIFKEEEQIEEFLFTVTEIEKEEPVETLLEVVSNQESHKPLKIIQCPKSKCKKLFNNLCESLLHMQQKCKELFQCEKCQTFCKSKKSLLEHIKVKHKPPMNQSDLKCDVCEKIFTSIHNIIKHKKEVHEKVKNYFCDVCGKGFYSISPLRFHKQSHMTESERVNIRKKKYNSKNNSIHRICDICGKNFEKISDYNNHIVIHKNPKCHICGLSANVTNLRAHMRVHTGEKPFACKQCDSTFRTAPQLRVHESAVHLGEKKYECNICGKRLGYKFSYDAHMNRHAGNANYKCSLCPMKFYEPRPLRVHKQKCHDLVEFENSENLLQK